MIFKLIYYGPALSGKTTNLLCLHDSSIRGMDSGSAKYIDLKREE